MEKLRAFVAFSISDALRKRLGEIQTKIGQNMPHLRASKPQGIHITLSFLGDITQNQVYKIGEAMEAVCAKHEPMDFLCRKVGGFPDMEKPRVLWAGMDGDTDKMQAFHKDLTQVLKSIGMATENQPFTPHLTLFRLKQQKQMGALRKRIKSLSQESFGPIHCDTLILYRSNLAPEGATYTKLKMVALD
jgi:2'-5' RNA ligase